MKNKIQGHYLLDDETFAAGFEACTLEPILFTHEAHLRLAWIHLKKHGLNEAIINIRTQLMNFVNHVGAYDKYHETLTIAAVKIVHHFMLKSSASDFCGLITEYPVLKTNFKSLIEAHYGFDVFNSEQAKKEFIAPDLQPFDLVH